MQDVIKRSCEPFRALLQALPEVERRNAREIRIRAGQPVRVLGLSDTALGAQGRPFCPSEAQVAELLRAFCGQSPYAFEEQMANGYLTLPGGHRVGLCGHAVLREGKLARLSKVQGMNIRIARQVPAAGAVLSFLMNGGGRAQYAGRVAAGHGEDDASAPPSPIVKRSRLSGSLGGRTLENWPPCRVACHSSRWARART